MTPTQEAKAKTVPTKYRGVYRRAASGKSRKAACRAFCLECVAWVEKEVGRCTSPACPLYPYRPATGAAATDDE